ncbi:MAG: hypothetical protein M3Z09_01645 [Acidobacteriota bacterium]|nr:hypothetical protein [Acidobacteriota bacterium]
MWKLAFCLIVPIVLQADILPANVGSFRKTAVSPLQLENRPVWDEYGLQASEQATFEAPGRVLHVRAYRMQDSTGALAAWQWQCPADSRPADPKVQELSKLASITATGECIALGNHFLAFEGYQPNAEELAIVFRSLPRQQSGPLPTLPEHLPDANLIPNSERYVLGPASLALFTPEVSPSAVAFHLGTEAQLGSFRNKTGAPLKLAIFSYPTLDSARDRTAALQKTPDSIVKRAGPLVAVVFSPADQNAAESLLSQVRYQAVVTSQDRSDRPPTKKDNFGNFMINVFELIGILLAFSLVSGVVFGGFRTLFRRAGDSGEGDTVISLHLDNR